MVFDRNDRRKTPSLGQGGAYGSRLGRPFQRGREHRSLYREEHEHSDADYVNGILVFNDKAPVINVDADTPILENGPVPDRVRLIQNDYEPGEYGVLDAAWGEDRV